MDDDPSPRGPGVTALTVRAPGQIALLPASAVPSAMGGVPRMAELPLADDEVCGRTICSLMSPGTEIANAFQPADPVAAPGYPWVPGYACVFVVAETGAAVDGVVKGDLVLSMGGHRSHQRERADRVWRLPDGLDPFVAVFARLMAIPMATLTTTRARPGSAVGVSGLGPVGHLAAAVFDRAGYQVVAWDPRPERRALIGPTIRTLPAAPEGRGSDQFGTSTGFDLVLECSGHDGAAVAACRVVRALGEVVLVGTPWARQTDVFAHELLREVFFRYVVLRSGWEWELPPTPTAFISGSLQSNIRLALDWLAAGVVAVEALATRVRPADAQATYDAYAEARAPNLTAVFDWTS